MPVARLPVHGADVSHHQGALDLQRAKGSGLDWLYHKATEGTTVVDSEYNQRRDAARKAGLPFGAYHFARPDGGDAVAEARTFLAKARPRPGDLAPCLDLEVTGGLSQVALKRWAKAFSDEVFRQVGVLPVLYSPWNLGLPNIRWVPRYNDTNTPPTIPWDIWQFSDGRYGVPNSYPGLGHVDLNTMRDGFPLRKLLIPSPVEKRRPFPKSQTVFAAHISMQFKDSDRQQRADARKIFARAQRRNYAWITGTEAGPVSSLAKILREVADEYGYRFYKPRGGSDTWIAVRETFIDGDFRGHHDPVIPGKAGRYAAKGVTYVTFRNDRLGRICVIAGHGLTDSRNPGDRHWDENRRLMRAVGEVAAREGKGHALAFYGGDQNISDRRHDTFIGAPLTSFWDEVERWENTGHGPIDVMATYDKDGRVQVKWINALNDREFRLHSDHFLVEGAVEIALR